MEVMNGKIVAIDEDELFDLYLKRGMDDIFSFPEYIERFKAAGTLILPGKQEDENEPTQTNADRIREMSDEELADYFSKTFCHGYGKPQFIEWLKQPADDWYCADGERKDNEET